LLFARLLRFFESSLFRVVFFNFLALLTFSILENLEDLIDFLSLEAAFAMDLVMQEAQRIARITKMEKFLNFI
jgi:hypothetical protein